VPLVESEQLFGWDRIARPDAARRKAARDPVDMSVERHGSQAGRIGHFFSCAETNML
jgi:hypothetical protein